MDEFETMERELGALGLQPRPTGTRPLMGLTILVVEDSRYASEALRLMCLRSGARIRRADCMASAKRHLGTYRPSDAIVDLGLPDGSGLDLISQMATGKHKVPILLGTSGAEREAAARACGEAGADGFLPKPVTTLAAFQAAILEHLPDALRPMGVRPAAVEEVLPDPVALREDLSHAMSLIDLDTPPVGYLRRFLIGLARGARDGALERSALAMDGGFGSQDRSSLRDLILSRIDALPRPI